LAIVFDEMSGKANSFEQVVAYCRKKVFGAPGYSTVFAEQRMPRKMEIAKVTLKPESVADPIAASWTSVRQ